MTRTDSEGGRARSAGIAYLLALAAAVAVVLGAIFLPNISPRPVHDYMVMIPLLAVVTGMVALAASILPYLVFRAFMRRHGGGKLSWHMAVGVLSGVLGAGLVAMIPDWYSVPEPRPSDLEKAISLLKLTLPAGVAGALTYWWAMRVRT
jgi:hypothetical protein